MSRRSPSRFTAQFQNRLRPGKLLFLLTKESIAIVHRLRISICKKRLGYPDAQIRLTIHETCDILALVRRTHGIAIALFCQGKSESGHVGSSCFSSINDPRDLKIKSAVALPGLLNYCHQKCPHNPIHSQLLKPMTARSPASRSGPFSWACSS